MPYKKNESVFLRGMSKSGALAERTWKILTVKSNINEPMQYSVKILFYSKFISRLTISEEQD